MCFENKGKIQSLADVLQASRHAPGKVLIFETARAQDEERGLATNFNVLYFEGVYHDGGVCRMPQTGFRFNPGILHPLILVGIITLLRLDRGI